MPINNTLKYFYTILKFQMSDDQVTFNIKIIQGKSLLYV